MTVVEFFSNDSTHCLRNSIPIKELFAGIDLKFRKTKINNDLFERYKIKKLPCLLFFSNGKLIGKIEGYYEFKDKKKIKERINKIISRIK